MTDRRFFGERERAALWLAAGGRCVLCGDVLSVGWHADHIDAYANGGETDVVNGQALCPPCNLKKGDGVVLTGGWPANWPLREWQNEAYVKFLASQARDFLVVATPGAGKTTFGLRAACHSVQDGESEYLLVVVPTEHLKKQWAKNAAKVGINLQDDFRNGDGVGAPGFDGLVTTYASLASNPLVYRALCSMKRTFVILDEPHRMGDDLTWGKAAKLGLEPATRRLLISGTPWRENGEAIPFARYSNGTVVADHTYTYAKAISDGVCRPVMFPRFDGEMRWESERGEQVATFTDEIPQEEASRRLRTALNPRNQWLSDVLVDAHQQLMELRRDGHPAAGGLVCCIDQEHAQSVVHLLRGITGQAPVLAISSEPESSDRIEKFGESYDPWIVAVKMISEGVDIPRLAVGVYASNVISFRSFMQFIGRFTRAQVGAEDLVSRVNLPNDPTLVRYAAQVTGEVDAGLDDLLFRSREQREDDGISKQPGEPRSAGLFTPGWSGPAEFVGVTTVEGEDISRQLYERAEALARARGRTSREDFLWLAQVLRDAGTGIETPEPRQESAAVSLNVERRRLMGARDRGCRQVGALFKDATGRDDGFMAISGRLKRLCGGVAPRQASVEQLQQAIEILKSWRSTLVDAREGGTISTWVLEWEQGIHDGEHARATVGAR